MTPLAMTPRSKESQIGHKHQGGLNVWKIVALSSSFLLFLNIIYQSTSTAIEQTKNAVKRSLLDDKQAVSPLPDEVRYKSLKQEAPILGEAGSNPPAYAGARPCPTESVPRQLLHIVKEACRLRSKVNGNLFITTYQGDETGLVNWKSSLDRLNIDEWLVIAMNDYANQQLARWNIPHIHFEGTGEPSNVLKDRESRYRDGIKRWHKGEEDELEKKVFLKMLWNQRIRIIHALLKSGTTVTHCDYDAVLQKDPRPFTDFLLEKYDIVASQGDWPFPRYKSFGRDIGTSIQMGYVTFKSSRRMQTFFENRVLQVVNKMGDDQEAVNVALVRDGARQTTNVTQEKWSGLNKRTVETDSGINVYYVPEKTFVRYCMLKDKAVLQNATMCHCKKDAEPSGIPKDIANKYGYWFLEEKEEKRLLALK